MKIDISKFQITKLSKLGLRCAGGNSKKHGTRIARKKNGYTQIKKESRLNTNS
jgi:hypothetical protein